VAQQEDGKMIKIIYEDNHIIVVEKPYNIPVMEDISKDEDMLSKVKKYIKEKYKKPGNVFLALVHRLDRPVGGVMVFAKTSKSASRLSELIRTNKFSKTYLCIVKDILKEKTGILENYLYKNRQENKSYVVNKNIKDSKLAKLEYEVLDEKNEFSLLKINLITGRHHQIRVQLANIGYPIFGDQKYNKDTRKIQIALWAYEISFLHPTKKEILTFKCEPNYEMFPWSLFI